MKRIAQPPIHPALRDREYHSFWPGMVTSLIGLVLLVGGARHMTGVETKDGSTAWETQLVKAFASGGLQYASHIAPSPPPKTDDPAALERWARESAQAETPTWKVRVDTEANTPCPT